MKHMISCAAKKGFLIVHRRAADLAFRENMPDDRLIDLARKELGYSPKTVDVDIWISLHLVWQTLDA